MSTNRHITLVVLKENERIEKSACRGTLFHSKAEYYPDTYIWAGISYFKESAGNVKTQRDILFNQSSYWSKWRENKRPSLNPLTAEHLQKNLWDADRQQMKYDKLLHDFVQNYLWVFPPNVVELHKELVAREAAA